jgi:large subunit ribosomal protein L25
MQVELNVKTRGEIGSPDARRQRMQGEMPGIVYGLGMEPISILVDSSDFKTSLKTEAGSNVIINLNIDESNTVITLPREIQRHPYKDEILHVDFVQIDLTKKVIADVAVELLGIPIGVKEEGGVVQTVQTFITISAIATEIPTSLELDISDYVVGDIGTVQDVKLPENVELAKDNDESLIVTVNIPREVVEEEEVDELLEGELLEGEEGEVSDGEGAEGGVVASEESAEQEEATE